MRSRFPTQDWQFQDTALPPTRRHFPLQPKTNPLHRQTLPADYWWNSKTLHRTASTIGSHLQSYTLSVAAEIIATPDVVSAAVFCGRFHLGPLSQGVLQLLRDQDCRLRQARAPVACGVEVPLLLLAGNLRVLLVRPLLRQLPRVPGDQGADGL